MHSLNNDHTPSQDGFYMPAEWHPQSAIWMLWPEREDNWHSQALPAQKAFLELAIAMSQFTLVNLGVSPPQYAYVAAQLLQLNPLKTNPPNIILFEIESDDAWLRDTGPTFVINQNEIRAIDWRFNAWGGVEGGLYADWRKDDQVALQIAKNNNISAYSLPDFVLEGGAIDVDGEGTLLVTRECLLNPNRNPHLSEDAISAILQDYFNVSKIIWLPLGLAFDNDTNGHIDNMCRFIRPSEVLLAWTDHPDDPNYHRCNSAFQLLSMSTDARGRSFIIHKIPIPKPIIHTDDECQKLSSTPGSVVRGAPIGASYVNFLITNQAVIVPSFGDDHDQYAHELFQQLFPDYQIVPIFVREIILGGGGIHCITQQQPKLLGI